MIHKGMKNIIRSMGRLCIAGVKERREWEGREVERLKERALGKGAA